MEDTFITKNIYVSILELINLSSDLSELRSMQEGLTVETLLNMVGRKLDDLIGKAAYIYPTDEEKEQFQYDVIKKLRIKKSI